MEHPQAPRPSPPTSVQGSDQGVAAELVGRGFAPAMPDHPLACLSGRRWGRHRLEVLLGPQNRVGAHYFQLWGRASQTSRHLLTGLHHWGPHPAMNWIEVMALGAYPQEWSSRGIVGERALARLFSLLRDATPPGGHLMVEYESPSMAETLHALVGGVPPVLTPLGHAMFLAGFGWGLRDWYIAEGWSEGPRKLQGFHALDAEHLRRSVAHLAQELATFATSTAGQRYLKEARSARRRLREVVARLLEVEPAVDGELKLFLRT